MGGNICTIRKKYREACMVYLLLYNRTAQIRERERIALRLGSELGSVPAYPRHKPWNQKKQKVFYPCLLMFLLSICYFV